MKKILVHAHIYYTNLWPELLDCINNIPYPYDLYITTVESNRDFAENLRQNLPSAHIEIVPNKGYDVGPFIHILKQIDLNDYSYVIKLHTKRDIALSKSKYRTKTISDTSIEGPNWRNMLLDPFRTTNRIRKIVETMEHSPNIGIVANYRLYRERKAKREEKSRVANITQALQNLHLSMPPKIKFVAGTMFIARAKVFAPIANSTYTIDSFETPDTQHTDNTLAHTFERVLSYTALAQGYDIRDCYTPIWKILIYKIKKLWKFIYEHKITDSDKRIIKILRIPVWNKKIKN